MTPTGNSKYRVVPGPPDYDPRWVVERRVLWFFWWPVNGADTQERAVEIMLALAYPQQPPSDPPFVSKRF